MDLVKVVARGFYVASAVVALVLLTLATVDAVRGINDFTFVSAIALWLGTGFPLVIAGFVLTWFLRRRSSMRMPPHHPDWMRDQSDR